MYWVLFQSKVLPAASPTVAVAPVLAVVPGVSSNRLIGSATETVSH